MLHFLSKWNPSILELLQCEPLEMKPQMNNANFSFELPSPAVHTLPRHRLRVVRTKAILFLKSISDRSGSDIERL